MQPIPIDLISDGPGWWVQWLPFAGSVIVAAVAYLGIRRSNQTNLKAIDAADQRSKREHIEDHEHDFKQWQRETLMKSATEIIELASSAAAKYKSLAGGSEDMFHSGAVAEIAAMEHKIGVNSSTIELIGIKELVGPCKDLQAKINNQDLRYDVLESNQKVIKRVGQSKDEIVMRDERVRFGLDLIAESRENVADIARGLLASLSQPTAAETTE